MKEIGLLKPDQIHEVLAKDPLVSIDIEAWTKDQGHLLLQVLKKKNYLKIYVKEKGQLSFPFPNTLRRGD